MSVVAFGMQHARMARVALGLSEDDLARRAGLTAAQITAFENGSDATPAFADALAAAFEQAGITFRRLAEGGAVIRIQTLDGIIEAPVPVAK